MMPMVMYMSLTELVKAAVQVPRLTRKPPIITTGRWPKRLLSMVARGAAVGEEGHYSGVPEILNRRSPDGPDTCAKCLTEKGVPTVYGNALS